MVLKTTICVLVHHVLHAKPNLSAQPWFQVLNSHQEQFAYPGLAISIM